MKLAALAICAALSGCALLGPSSLDDNGAGVMHAGSITPSAALAAAAPGKTKSEVGAVLGRANVIAFDSGWEVWVYRWPGADRSTQGAAEVVVLFDAQGIVKKARMRPGSR